MLSSNLDQFQLIVLTLMWIAYYLIEWGGEEGGLEYCMGGRGGMQREKEFSFFNLCDFILCDIFFWNKTLTLIREYLYWAWKLNLWILWCWYYSNYEALMKYVKLTC
jgi:hypothetical protein